MKVQSQLSNLMYRYLAYKNTEYRSIRCNDSLQSSCTVNNDSNQSSHMMDNSYLSSIMTQNSDESSSMINKNCDHSSSMMTKTNDPLTSMMRQNTDYSSKNVECSSIMLTKNINYSPSMRDDIITPDNDIDQMSPSEKTRLLISLVPHLHVCVDIMQKRSLNVQTGLHT